MKEKKIVNLGIISPEEVTEDSLMSDDPRKSSLEKSISREEINF